MKNNTTGQWMYNLFFWDNIKKILLRICGAVEGILSESFLSVYCILYYYVFFFLALQSKRDKKKPFSELKKLLHKWNVNVSTKYMKLHGWFDS